MLVGMTRRAPLDRLQGWFGGRVRQASRATARWRAAFAWSVGGSVAVRVLRALFSYLVVKRPQAVVAFLWEEWHPGAAVSGARRKDHTWDADAARFIYEKMRALNHRGPKRRGCGATLAVQP